MLMGLIGLLTGDSESIMIEEKYEDSNLQPKQEKTKKESTTLSPGTTPWGTAKNEYSQEEGRIILCVCIRSNDDKDTQGILELVVA